MVAGRTGCLWTIGWLAMVACVIAACSSPSTIPTPNPGATSPEAPGTSPAVTRAPTASLAPSVAPSPPGSSTDPSADVPGTLGEALAYLGPVPQRIMFTDWAALRAAAGAEGLTSGSPFEAKAQAVRNDATAVSFRLRSPGDAATWGFDAFDLEWEAWAYGLGGNVDVVRFRDGVDTDVVSAKLDEYGFTTEQLPRGVLRTDTGRGTALLQPVFAFTAILDDGRTLVMSGESVDIPRSVLTDGPTPAVDPSLRSVARLLDAPAVADLYVGDYCHQVDQGIERLSADARAPVAELLQAAGPLGAFNAVAYGYDWGDDPIGRIVIGYPDEAGAQADLAGRAQLAREGTSLGDLGDRVGIRYADGWFTLADARVVERSIVLRVGPVASELRSPDPPNPMATTNFLPSMLFRMFEQRNMLFAACPE